MNIVFISIRGYPEPGGVTQHNYFLAKNLSEIGVKVFNLTPMPSKEVYDEIKNTKWLKHHYLPLKNPGNFVALPLKLFFAIRFVLWNFLYLIKIHKKERISLIYTHSPHINGIAARLFSGLFRVPFVYAVHGLDHRYYLEYTLDCKLVLPYASVILPISRRVQYVLDKLLLKTDKPYYLLSNGIECEKHIIKKSRKEIIQNLEIQELDKDDVVIISVGVTNFLSKTRGMLDFLKAFDEFLSLTDFKDAKKIKAILICEGHYKSLIERARDNMIHGDQVLLSDGFVRNVDEYFAIASLNVLVSHVEGFPTVVLEAMCNNVPSIVTNVGESARITGDSGITVEPGNLIQIIHALKSFFENPSKKRELQKEIPHQLRLYKWHQVAEEMKKMFQLVISANTSAKIDKKFKENYFKISNNFYVDKRHESTIISSDFNKGKEKIKATIKIFCTKECIRLG